MLRMADNMSGRRRRNLAVWARGWRKTIFHLLTLALNPSFARGWY
jgi:hypothetical protein